MLYLHAEQKLSDTGGIGAPMGGACVNYVFVVWVQKLRNIARE